MDFGLAAFSPPCRRYLWVCARAFSQALRRVLSCLAGSRANRPRPNRRMVRVHTGSGCLADGRPGGPSSRGPTRCARTNIVPLPSRIRYARCARQHAYFRFGMTERRSSLRACGSGRSRALAIAAVHGGGLASSRCPPRFVKSPSERRMPICKHIWHDWLPTSGGNPFGRHSGDQPRMRRP